MGDPIKELYQALKSTNIFLDEEDLKAQLKASPKDVYRLVSSNKDVAGLFVDYDDFLSVTGLKKKIFQRLLQMVAKLGVLLVHSANWRGLWQRRVMRII